MSTRTIMLGQYYKHLCFASLTARFISDAQSARYTTRLLVRTAFWSRIEGRHAVSDAAALVCLMNIKEGAVWLLANRLRAFNPYSPFVFTLFISFNINVWLYKRTIISVGTLTLETFLDVLQFPKNVAFIEMERILTLCPSSGNCVSKRWRERAGRTAAWILHWWVLCCQKTGEAIFVLKVDEM
jgi:hypothetical protein